MITVMKLFIESNGLMAEMFSFCQLDQTELNVYSWTVWKNYFIQNQFKFTQNMTGGVDEGAL